MTLTRQAVLILLLALTAAGCTDSLPIGPPEVAIGETIFDVELALDESTRRRGLGGRTELAGDAGMLFTFTSERVVRFHMLDCRIPLDVAFIGADLTIVEIRTMQVEPDPAKPQAYYPSRFPALYALEVPAGTFDRLGIKPGATVRLLGEARNASKDAR